MAAVSKPALHLFEAFGIEIEYMIVERRTLAVKPVADLLLKSACGTFKNEVVLEDISWSNELVLHLLELKTSGPAQSLIGLERQFQANVRRINELLDEQNCCLLPTAMHPWMDPARETRLWSHQFRSIYRLYHKIFNCYSHGWANLQSMHLNLPFADDEEFGRLHAAVRLLLPILPALTASSPIINGAFSGLCDTRLEVYRLNQRLFPGITGYIIPEPVYTKEKYEEQILQPMYRSIAPYDPKNILRHEWLNSRGAIARFDRNTIEIRMMDVQECPAADLAAAAAVVAVLRCLVAEKYSPLHEQQQFDTEQLRSILLPVIRNAEQAVIMDSRYLAMLGRGPGSCTAGELWRSLLLEAQQDDPQLAQYMPQLRTIMQEGPLARRIMQRLPTVPSPETLLDLYLSLTASLQHGKQLSIRAARKVE